jgi:hypothetical protein
MSDNPTSKLNLAQSLTDLNNSNLIQQVRSVGTQPRPASTSPNTIADSKARSLSTPAHVANVHASLSRTSDVSSKVTVTFKRDPTDYYFSNAVVYVSGYKNNPAPVQVASGQSPISFALENTGDAVSVTVQAVGNLGPAPLSTAPNATLKLDKTALVTTPTAAGNGTGSSTSVTNIFGPRPSYGVWRGWTCVGPVQGASVLNATGCYGCSPVSAGSSSLALVAGTATEGAYLQLNTAVANGSHAVFAGDGVTVAIAGLINLPRLVVHQARVKMGTVTSAQARYWIGVGDQAGSEGSLTSDTPALNLCAFRFHAGVDANWQCITQTDATHHTITDSGIAGDLNPHLFEIGYSAGSVIFKIDGSQVASNNTNLPASSVNMSPFAGVDNIASGASQNIKIAFNYWEVNP